MIGLAYLCDETQTKPLSDGRMVAGREGATRQRVRRWLCEWTAETGQVKLTLSDSHSWVPASGVASMVGVCVSAQFNTHTHTMHDEFPWSAGAPQDGIVVRSKRMSECESLSLSRSHLLRANE